MIFTLQNIYSSVLSIIIILLVGSLSMSTVNPPYVHLNIKRYLQDESAPFGR